MTSGFLKTKIKTSLRPCMERMFRQFIDSGVRLGCRAHHPAPPLCLHSAFHHTTSSRAQCGYHTIQPYCRRVYDVRAFVWGCGVCMGRMCMYVSCVCVSVCVCVYVCVCMCARASVSTCVYLVL